MKTATGSLKELEKIQKDSLEFIQDVYKLIGCLEDEMKSPSGEGREKRISESLNALELRTDCFAHFTLGKFFESMAREMEKEK